MEGQLLLWFRVLPSQKIVEGKTLEQKYHIKKIKMGNLRKRNREGTKEGAVDTKFNVCCKKLWQKIIVFKFTLRFLKKTE